MPFLKAFIASGKKTFKLCQPLMCKFFKKPVQNTVIQNWLLKKSKKLSGASGKQVVLTGCFTSSWPLAVVATGSCDGLPALIACNANGKLKQLVPSYHEDKSKPHFHDPDNMAMIDNNMLIFKIPGGVISKIKVAHQQLTRGTLAHLKVGIHDNDCLHVMSLPNWTSTFSACNHKQKPLQ